jgi:hypothetical protein
MDTQLRQGLAALWKLGEKIHGEGGDGRAVAEAIAWLLPQAQLCGVYSRPMGTLEMFAVRVGNAVVGQAGVWAAGDYGSQVRKAGLSPAPCYLRDHSTKAEKVSPILTESMARSPEFQELLLAA